MIENIFKYYLDCILEDSGEDVKAFASGHSLSYFKLTVPELTSRDNNLFTSSELQSFKDLYRRQTFGNQRKAWWYGYPNVYKFIIGRNGWQGGIIKPLFIMPIEIDANQQAPKLNVSPPRINSNAFRDLGFALEEVRSLCEELGLFDDNIQSLNLYDVVSKLKILEPSLSWKENRNVDYQAFGEEGEGIYSDGVIYVSEASNYVQGLEYELKQLSNHPGNIPATAINPLFTNNLNRPPANKKREVIEAVSLNEQQKEAVESSLSNNLTVITGPPGTGKSQVVAAIVINAVRNGERVLVASKNHKAVDVVEERLNQFADRPFVIRLGNKGTDDRNIQQELIQYLNSLLGSNVTDSQKQLHLEKQNQLNSFINERRKIILQIEEYRTKRNLLNQLSANFEKIKNIIGSAKAFKILAKRKNNNSFFSKLGFAIIPTRKVIAKYSDAFNNLISQNDFESLCIKLDKLNLKISSIAAEELKLWLDTLPGRLDPGKRNTLAQYLSVLQQFVQADNNTPRNVWANLFRQKESLMRELSGFLPAWCVTNLSTRGQLPLIPGFFDLVIIDEASQCDIPSAIPLLYRAKRSVIIGDPNQLQHISTMKLSRSLTLMNGYKLSSAEYSVFEYTQNSLFRLASGKIGESGTIMLNEHFRSHKDIIQFSNKIWYAGILSIGTDYRLLNPPTAKNESSVQWINTSGRVIQNEGSGAYIKEEVEKIVHIVKKIVETGYSGEIGVVTPFRLQANKIREKLVSELPSNIWSKNNLLVNTAVKFQGDERDIIIFSPVVSEIMPRGVKYYLESTMNLFNVAITRARAKLIIVGNLNACSNCGITILQQFAKYVQNLGQHTDVKSKFENTFESIYEEELYNQLIKRNIKVIPQYNIDQFRLDLAYVNEKIKLDIEVDGKEFHTDWSGQRLKQDLIRNIKLQKLGWKVLRFWSYEIRDNMDYCINKIHNTINHYN